MGASFPFSFPSSHSFLPHAQISNRMLAQRRISQSSRLLPWAVALFPISSRASLILFAVINLRNHDLAKLSRLTSYTAKALSRCFSSRLHAIHGGCSILVGYASDVRWTRTILGSFLSWLDLASGDSLLPRHGRPMAAFPSLECICRLSTSILLESDVYA